MTLTQTKWLLRLALPAAGFVIALLCGRSIGGAIGILALTALIMVLLVVFPAMLLGMLFLPVLGVYGLKFSDRKEPEMDLHDPDTRLFLFLGIPATLATVGLLALYLRV